MGSIDFSITNMFKKDVIQHWVRRGAKYLGRRKLPTTGNNPPPRLGPLPSSCRSTLSLMPSSSIKKKKCQMLPMVLGKKT